MGAKPARLRPALPQHWVQAVDERAADSSTPTSARSLPDPPATSAGTPNTADTASPFEAAEAADDQAGLTGVMSHQAGTDRRTDRLPLPQQTEAANTSSGKAEPEAYQAELLQQGTINARSDAATEGQRTPPPAQPATAAEQPPLLALESAEQVQLESADGGASHGRDAADSHQGTLAGQTAGRDAVSVQQAAARDSKAWQHAGLGGTVAPLTPEASIASPPQPVPEAEQPLTTASEAEQTASEVPEAAIALPPNPPAAGVASASDGLATVEKQEALNQGTQHAAHAVDLNRGQQHSDLPVPAGMHATDGSQGLSQPSRQTPVTHSAQGQSHQTSQHVGPSFTPQSDSRPIPGARDAESPSTDDYQVAQSAGTTEGRGALPDQQGQGSRATPEYSGPKSAAMLSLEAMIPPPFEFGSPSNSPTFAANAQALGPANPDLPAAQAGPTVPGQSPSDMAGSSAVTSPAPDQTGMSHPGMSHPGPASQAADDSNIAVTSGFHSQQPTAPPLRGEPSHELLSRGSSGARLTRLRLNSPEVQRRIEQTAEDVQQAVNERGGAQAFGVGAEADERGQTSSDALARATGTLRALVAGHLEEAESLSRSLPTHSGAHCKCCFALLASSMCFPGSCKAL